MRIFINAYILINIFFIKEISQQKKDNLSTKEIFQYLNRKTFSFRSLCLTVSFILHQNPIKLCAIQ